MGFVVIGEGLIRMILPLSWFGAAMPLLNFLALDKIMFSERQFVMTTTVPTRPFSRDEYYAMARLGILRLEERVELVSGETIAMTPPGTPHAAFVVFLDAQLQRAFGDQFTVHTGQRGSRLAIIHQ